MTVWLIAWHSKVFLQVRISLAISTDHSFYKNAKFFLPTKTGVASRKSRQQILSSRAKIVSDAEFQVFLAQFVRWISAYKWLEGI